MGSPDAQGSDDDDDDDDDASEADDDATESNSESTTDELGDESLSSTADDSSENTTDDDDDDADESTEDQDSSDDDESSDASDGNTSATESTNGDDSTSSSEGSDETTSTGSLCEGDQPVVRIETSMGIMDITLDRVHAPKTVDNFMAYVEAGSYDGVIFHRVIKGFVIQGGGYLPGMKEIETMPPIELEISEDLRHDDGAIAMALEPDKPNSGASQFYICDGAQHGLDDQYAVFGLLTAGQDVLREIAAVPTTMDVPNDDVVMTKVHCVAP